MIETVATPILRSIFAFLLALLMTRFMGRKSISQMTFFDFVVGITLGSVTATLSIGSLTSVISVALALITLSVLSIITGFMHIKSFKGRKLINSEPVVLVDKGKIVNQNLKKVRTTIGELTSMLREKNVFSMADVEFAIMENDGKLSVMPKAEKQPLTPSDMGVPVASKDLMKDVIIDGEIMYENLQSANLNGMWLVNQLKAQGMQDAKDVFYAGVDSSGNLYVSPKQQKQEKEGQHGIE